MNNDISLKELIKIRKSSKSLNKRLDELFIRQIIRESYNSKGFNSTPSAGGIYGVNLLLITNNSNKKILFNIQEEKESEFSFLVNLEHIISIEKEIGSNSLLIMFTIELEKYKKKYSSCSSRYALIEVGCVLQNLQLILLSNGIKSCPIGTINERKLNINEEVVISLFINID